MKSILQDKGKICYICANFFGNYQEHDWVHEHHIFEGTANRRLSEKYGLKVYLCAHHHTGDIYGSRDAVHSKGDNDFDIRLKQIAQIAFEREHRPFGRKLFMKTFGKNYLEEES